MRNPLGADPQDVIAALKKALRRRGEKRIVFDTRKPIV
jgi:hypothetical protein